MASTERPTVRRGEVWLVALDPVVGPERAKSRLCVVVQREAANRASLTTIVVEKKSGVVSTRAMREIAARLTQMLDLYAGPHSAD